MNSVPRAWICSGNRAYFATEPWPDHLTIELVVESSGEFGAITSPALIRTQY
ncbi:hypothetical protein [Saccharopolyspora spinosa]|uniref:Uncharacterized protein n=1 Tax=Saccharopolyspora spinosa TaxID=60894 RepID=A0A2N3XXJ4_SACSN|nr:hypothetical protein [Saccharopolyspora spinosa]PKW15385.1 hypothetical protein A8926_3085 [Saccharopolyspora spinosa]